MGCVSYTLFPYPSPSFCSGSGSGIEKMALMLLQSTQASILTPNHDAIHHGKGRRHRVGVDARIIALEQTANIPDAGSTDLLRCSAGGPERSGMGGDAGDDRGEVGGCGCG
jgi:hypothetical protein